MSTLASFEIGQYKAPEDAVDFGERYADKKAILLYIGEKAIVDVVDCPDITRPNELGMQILRLVDSPEKGPAMLNHTANFLPPDLAQEVFGSPRAA